MQPTIRILVLILGSLTLVPAGHAPHSPAAVATMANHASAAPIGAAPRRADTAVSSDWPMARGNSARTGATAGPGVATDPAVVWRFEPTAPSLLVGSPVAAGGSVYVASDDGVLYALDAATGAERWRFAGLAVDDFWQHALAVGGDLVYVAGFERPTAGDRDRLPVLLRALDVATGAEHWRLALEPGWSLGRPTLADDVLYVAAAGARQQKLLLALDAATGTERWREETFGSDPAVDGDALYLQAFGQQAAFVSLDATTGTRRWQFVAAGIWQTTDPVVADGLVYVVAREQGSSRILLTALDAATGAERWRIPIECCTYGGLAVAGGVVYVTSGLEAGTRYPDDVLLALDANTGEERWRVAGIGGTPAVAGDTIYGIAFPEGSVVHNPFESVTLVAVDAATGTERWRLDEVGADVIAAGDMIYALRPIGLAAIASSPSAGPPTIVTPIAPSDETLRTAPTTTAERADGTFELVLTSLDCPEGVGPKGVVTEHLADIPAADIEAQGCERAGTGDVLFTLLAQPPEGGTAIAVAQGWTDANGEAVLRGPLIPGASYVLDEPLLTWGSAATSLAPPLAAAYTVVHHDAWEPSTLTIRVLTCPVGTADPVTACRDNRVDRRVYDDFDVRPKGGGGSSDADPSFIDVESQVGPITIAVLPSVLRRYLGAYVSCVDKVRNEVVFSGEANDGRVSFQLPAGSGTACEWYFLTPAGGEPLAAPIPPPAPSAPLVVDAPGLYVMAADGSEFVDLAAGEPAVAFPAWSPDGRRIAYLGRQRRHHVLYVVNVDGSERRQRSNLRLAAVPPSWSPDGRQIAVETVDGAIYAVAVDGFGATKLIETGEQTPPAEGYAELVGWPAWSPAGDVIAFAAVGPDGEGTEIHVMSATGANPVPLTELPGDWHAFHPVWSPDGERLAFNMMRLASGGCATAVANADGTGLRVLDPCGGIAWSPDSAELLIEIYLGDGMSQIDHAGVDGSGAVTITGQGAFTLPAWSADGRLIAYLDAWTWDDGATIAVVTADGSEPVRLAVADGSTNIDWIGWSPAGDALAVQVSGDLDG